MIGSKLAMPILGQIWDLSDVDRDGFLDQYEFTVAMHLVFRALQGDKMPSELPEELSPEKVPKPLSDVPNLNSGAPKVRPYYSCSPPAAEYALVINYKFFGPTFPCWLMTSWERADCSWHHQ